MKKTNKYCENKKKIFKDDKKLGYNSYLNNKIKKEKIIKDLKLKGFNQRQITDIFETFISNIIDKENLNSKEDNNHSMQVKNFIKRNSNNNLIIEMNKNNNNKSKNFNTNSRDNILINKSPMIVKTENSLIINNKKTKCNYLKIFINSSENNRKSYLKKKDNENIKKIYNIPHSSYNIKENKKQNKTQSKNNIISIRKENLKKINSQNILNAKKKVEENKREILKKMGKEINLINYKKKLKLKLLITEIKVFHLN